MSSRIFDIFSFGVKKGNPDYINNKIRTSNQVAIASFLLTGLPFCFIFYIYLPSLFIIALIASIVAILVPIINLLGFQFLARTVIGLNGIVAVGIAHGYLVESGNPPLAASIVFEFAFSLLPFIVFHPKERKSLISITSFCFLYISLVQVRIDFFEIPHETIDFLKYGAIKDFSIISSSVIIYLFLWIISNYSFKAEKKHNLLVEEMQQKNKELKHSEHILRESLKTLDESKIEEQRRLWINEGITKFARIIRKASEGIKIYDELLSELIKYIKANQGAFYIIDKKEDRDEENVLIRLVSCYAYSRKKFMEQTIEPGEGLLGQCYYEKSVILLTEIPQDYVAITSGVGEAKPNCIVIVPLMLNDEVAGFLELASFNTFDDYVIALLKRISETLASFIINDRINEHATKLLQKSQEQTEMLRSQEEEMRQNFEELQATQDGMLKAQNELQTIKENLETELKDKLSQLENFKKNIDVLMNTSQDAIIYTDGDGNINMNNARTVKMFGYKDDELKETSVDQLFHSDKKALTACIKELKEGKSKVYENFIGKSKLYGFEFPVEIVLGKECNGEEVIVSLVARDISKKKKREDNIKKSLTQMQKLQQQLMQSQQEHKKTKRELDTTKQELASFKTEK